MTHEKMPEALRKVAYYNYNYLTAKEIATMYAACDAIERQHAEIERLREEVEGLRSEREVTKDDWIRQSVRVYVAAGDTESDGVELALYQWDQQDIDNIQDPYECALEDIEGRPQSTKEQP